MSVSLPPQKLTLRPSGVRFCRSSYKAMFWTILLVVIALRDAIGLGVGGQSWFRRRCYRYNAPIRK